MAVLIARLAMQKTVWLWPVWLAGTAACLLFIWQAISYLFASMPATSATAVFGVASLLYVIGSFCAEPFFRREFLKLDQADVLLWKKQDRDRLLNESDDYREVMQTVARLETDMGSVEWKDAKPLVDELVDDQLVELIRRRHKLRTEEKQWRTRSEQTYDRLVLSRGATREKKERAAVIATRASNQQTLSAIAQVAERIDATKNALDEPSKNCYHLLR